MLCNTKCFLKHNMLNPSFRIYLTANLIIWVLFTIALFPEGILFGMVAMAVSSVFSLPAFLLLLVCFSLIEKHRPKLILCWICLLLTVAFSVCIPSFILNIDASWPNDSGFIWMSVGAGFGALLLQSFYLHKYFKTFTMKTIKRLLLLFIVALFISGLTAIPVDAQLSFLLNHIAKPTALYTWIEKVLLAYREVNLAHPFLFYGHDWLAFAHFVLAILFIGPYRDPVKNIWIIQFGLIACVLVIPFAFIAGHFRGIPIGWRLIDCSFGVFGFALLYVIYTRIKTLINN